MNYSFFLHKIWIDKKFRQLSLNGKLLFFYLFGNESVNWTGIYEFDIDTCKIRIGLNTDFNKIFQEIIDKEMIKWDKDTETIWIINRFKVMLSVSNSHQIIQAVIKELKTINHPFKKDFIMKYKSIIGEGLFQLKDYKEYMPNAELLTEKHLRYLAETGWGKEKIKKHFLESNYSEQKIDEILARVLPNLK